MKHNLEMYIKEAFKKFTFRTAQKQEHVFELWFFSWFIATVQCIFHCWYFRLFDCL